MKFIGLEPLPQHEPLIELRRGSFVADLHNDALFEGFDVRRAHREVILRWRAKSATWQHEQQRVVAGVVLVFRDVEKLVASGMFISEGRSDISELDFVEHSSDAPSTSLRFVFDDASEIEVFARSCELRLVQTE